MKRSRLIEILNEVGGDYNIAADLILDEMEKEAKTISFEEALEESEKEWPNVLKELLNHDKEADLDRQTGEREGRLHGRAWVAAEYRVTGSPHEHAASDSLAMARSVTACRERDEWEARAIFTEGERNAAIARVEELESIISNNLKSKD